MHSDYTRPRPEPTTPGPRNPDPPIVWDPGDLAAFAIVARRQAARAARLSSITRLRGGL